MLAVQPASDDVLFHRPRNVVGDWLTFTDSPPNVSGRNLNQWHRHEIDPVTRIRNSRDDRLKVDVDSGSQGNTESGIPRNAIWIVPGWQIAQRILAHQEDQLGIRIVIPQDFQAVGGVGQARAVHVDRRYFKMRIAIQRGTQHLHAVVGWSDRLPGLVGRQI